MAQTLTVSAPLFSKDFTTFSVPPLASFNFTFTSYSYCHFWEASLFASRFTYYKF